MQDVQKFEIRVDKNLILNFISYFLFPHFLSKHTIYIQLEAQLRNQSIASDETSIIKQRSQISKIEANQIQKKKIDFQINHKTQAHFRRQKISFHIDLLYTPPCNKSSSQKSTHCSFAEEIRDKNTPNLSWDYSDFDFRKKKTERKY